LFFSIFPPPEGLTEGKNYVIFPLLKAVMKTYIPGKLHREEPFGVKAPHPCPECYHF
jgi:hypothetical protein